MNSRAVYFVLNSLILAGCASAPVRYDQQGEGQWQAKALIRDTRAGKSAIVNLDVNAVKNEKLRMDVTAAMGHPVASLVMDGDKMTYVLMETKEFYSGAPTESAMKPVLQAPIDPKLLYNVFFEIPIEDKSWSCTKDKNGFLVECAKANGDVIIQWTERKGRRKLVKLEHPRGVMQINVSSFQPKVEARAQLFELNPPKTFKQVR